jgi:hypothetical protein
VISLSLSGGQDDRREGESEVERSRDEIQGI